MKAIIAFIALTLATSILHAQSVRVTGARVIGAGLLELEGKQTVLKDDNSVGQCTEHKGSRLLKATTTIPMKGSTVFGATFDVSGTPKGGLPALRVIWRYPAPGIGGRMFDEVPGDMAIGSTTNTVYWTLGPLGDNSHVPGVWTVELWDGSRLLAKQEFNLVRAQ